MKTHERIEVYIHEFLTSALNGVKLSASRSGLFIAREGVNSIVWTRWWRENIPAPVESRTPTFQPVSLSLHWLNYPGTLTVGWETKYTSIKNMCDDQQKIKTTCKETDKVESDDSFHSFTWKWTILNSLEHNIMKDSENPFLITNWI